MAKNKNLNTAAKAKKDEFYTQRTDIEHELQHYWAHFADKVVFCNCDNPFESQFFFYFVMKFNFLKLKKLIVTSYTGSPIVQTELDFFGTQNYNPTFDKRRNAIRFDVNEIKDWNGDGAADLADVKLLLENNRNVVTYLNGNGDFRSPECVEALKEADIVVTNPPFSLFRGYVKQLIDFDKKFLIIGNINCITYKEIFPLIKENKIWLGYGMGRAISGFIVPEGYELYGTEARFENGKRIVATNQCLWLTNLEHLKRNRPYDLVCSYKQNPERYPRYDNYDAIEVSKTGDIPEDYFGVMGVPITFLDKYCPAQFELLGCSYQYGDCGCHVAGTDWNCYIDGKRMFKRLFIRRRRKQSVTPRLKAGACLKK